MSDPSIHILLNRAAGRRASASRPTVAMLHRELRRDVEEHNFDRSVEGLAPLVCPSLATLRRRVGLLDAGLVSAARGGKAVPRVHDRIGSVHADGCGRARGDGRRRPEPLRIQPGRRLGRPQAMVGLLMGVIEGGGDAPDLVRASMLLDAQDRLALHGWVDPATLDRVRRSVAHFLLCAARTRAATPDDLRRRVRLFGRRQGHGDDVVGIALASSVERDRRRLGLEPEDLA